jgi:hypothetical protein
MKGKKSFSSKKEANRLNTAQKRKAAEAIVDAAILGELGRKKPLVSQEDRESWVQALIDKPELTPKLFLRRP